MSFLLAWARERQLSVFPLDIVESHLMLLNGVVMAAFNLDRLFPFS